MSVPAGSGEGVVGAGGVISRALRGEVAYEDASGCRDARRRFPGIAHGDDKMFGRVFVGEVYHLVAVVEYQYAAVGKGAVD